MEVYVHLKDRYRRIFGYARGFGVLYAAYTLGRLDRDRLEWFTNGYLTNDEHEKLMKLSDRIYHGLRKFL